MSEKWVKTAGLYNYDGSWEIDGCTHRTSDGTPLNRLLCGDCTYARDLRKYYSRLRIGEVIRL